jgi:hypothetical protein
MSKFCAECGQEVGDNAQFCPNCGEKIREAEGEVTYSELIEDIIYINDNGEYRISKAKAIGFGFFILYVGYGIIFLTPPVLRMDIFLFVLMIFALFVAGVFWYCVCRGAGYLVRNYITN